MARIVIVTTRFPYFYTEAFLEAEYPYLNKSFENICFLPLFKGKVRESCVGAKVCDDYNELYSQKWKKYLVVLTRTDFYRNLWQHKSKFFRKNRILNTFKQQVHFTILKDVVLKNKELFTEDTIVYSYWFNAAVYAFLKLKEDLGLKYKVVCRAHRFDVYDEDGEMPNRSYCLRKIDKVFPISQDAIDTLSSKYGYKDKFELSRLGVKDYGVISKCSLDGTFHVLSVSQVHPRKRIKEIHEALLTFATMNTGVNVVWTHFGDGPYFNHLLEFAQTVSVPNFKIECKGRVPNTEVMSYISNTRIDVFINLSTSEGVPVSVMEAQSFGIPVIATDVGGTSEVMNSDNGILLSANPTNSEVVEALSKVMGTNYDRERIKEKWNDISNANVNFPLFVQKLKAII